MNCLCFLSWVWGLQGVYLEALGKQPPVGERDRAEVTEKQEPREQGLWHVQRVWGPLSVHFDKGHQCFWAEKWDKRSGWFCFVTKMGRMPIEENCGWLNECTLETPAAPRSCLIFWGLWHGIPMQVTFLLQGIGHLEYLFKSWVAPSSIQKLMNAVKIPRLEYFLWS